MNKGMEHNLERFGSARLPTPYGEFRALTYAHGGVEHLALTLGVASEVASEVDLEGASEVVTKTDSSENPNTKNPNKNPSENTNGNTDENPATLVRIHSECLTGDVFGSLRCDCNEQLAASLEMIAAEECGVLVYLRGQEGRGIGIGHKIRAYQLQDEGHDTVDANTVQGLEIDARSYEAASHILGDLGITEIRLMTNNPAKLELVGTKSVERIPLEISPTPENYGYLKTKRDRLGHLISNLGT